MFAEQIRLTFFICFSCGNVFVSGSSESNKVKQNPAEILKSTSDKEAEMSCSHSITYYDRILWYKQTARDIQLLGYMYEGTETLESGVNVKIKGNANKGDNCTLTIKELSPDSSAVYFCAAYHSAACVYSSLQKPPDLENSIQLRLSLHPLAPAFASSSDFLRNLLMSVLVDQTPAFLFKIVGESVDKEIRCLHSIPSYRIILWYKQDKHNNMKLLGYLDIETPRVEEDVKGKINFNGDGRQQSNLNISDLTLSDNAVYFCAASLAQC